MKMNEAWRIRVQIEERREMIRRIFYILKQREVGAPLEQELPQMSKQLEKSLYSAAQSLAEYRNKKTLQKRLEPLTTRTATTKNQDQQSQPQNSRSQEFTRMQRSLQEIRHSEMSSSAMTDDETVVLRDLRQLGTMKQKAEYIVDILIGCPYLFPKIRSSIYFRCVHDLSLLEKEPSIVTDTSDPSEESLFSYLCNCCQSRDSNRGEWENVLRKVWQANPEAVLNDPNILSTLIGVFRHERISEEWLDLIGTVGERWPKAYDDVVEDLPAIELNWRRLVRSSGQDRDEKSFIFDCYPHLIPHVSEFLVDMKTHSEITGAPCIQQVLDSFVGKNLICEVSGSGLPFWRITVVERQKGFSLRLQDMQMAEGVLSFFSKNMLPIDDCLVHVDDDGDVDRVGRQLAGCKVHKLRLCVRWSIPQGALDGIIRMVAQHSTIRNLTLSEIKQYTVGPVVCRDVVWMESSCFAELVNLYSLDLDLPIRSVHVAELLRNTQNLKRLNLSLFGRLHTDLVMEAVGQSGSLRNFACGGQLYGSDLCILVRWLETSNAALEKCRLWMAVCEIGTEEAKTQTASQTAIEYYCNLNRLGRGKLRKPGLSKAEFVVDVLGLLGSREKALEHLFPDVPDQCPYVNRSIRAEFSKFYDVLATSLLYDLLRENPAIWCTP